MASPAIIASIADKLLGVLERFLDPKQYDIARMKRLERRVEAAMKYVHANEKSGWYRNKPDKKIEKYMKAYRKQIFDVR